MENREGIGKLKNLGNLKIGNFEVVDDYIIISQFPNF